LRVRVFYHGKCFDGTASAAVFSRFYRERIHADAAFQFTGLVHRAGALFDEAEFDGDENVILDFKYSPSAKITWWFDHHESAFLTPEDAEHYRRGDKSHKFYDPQFKSCTKLLAQVAQEKFRFNPEPLQELIYWADIIDGAQFTSVGQAVEMKEPAMKLTMVVESTSDPEFLPRLIPLLAEQSLASVIANPLVAPLVGPLIERHRRSIEILRQRAECRQGTIYFDITDQELEGYNKFIPYYLYPQSVYSVGLSRSNFRVKVAVGSNPWTNERNMLNLARICERYGGGGHARVGAISFPTDQADAARRAASEIVSELRASQAGASIRNQAEKNSF
jgi:hypothetical protein